MILVIAMICITAGPRYIEVILSPLNFPISPVLFLPLYYIEGMASKTSMYRTVPLNIKVSLQKLRLDFGFDNYRNDLNDFEMNPSVA